jgi:23S rRNA (guanosine2251-2'-O)-methyltransferase
MSWQICQCSDPSCAFRFPAETNDLRRLHCPRCGSPTQSSQLAIVQDEPDRASIDSERPRLELHILLDNVRSTYNVGSLFRTADGAGVSSLHLCGITPTPQNLKVGKTALGAEQKVTWTYHRNALHAADSLKAAGVRLWALEATPGAPSLFELSPPQDHPLALIIGNEVTGVDPALLERSDRVVRLPMTGSKRSLNVASAAAVAIYWLCFGGS